MVEEYLYPTFFVQISQYLLFVDENVYTNFYLEE